MKKVRYISFKREHLELMDIREREKLLLFSDDDIESKLVSLEEVGNGFTVICEGRILGILGFIFLNQGVSEIWIVPSIYVSQYYLTFSRFTLEYLNRIIDTFKFHRIQMTTPDDELHSRWAEFLGFKKESVLKQFTAKKQDLNMWTRIM
jgi:hypothetical protein